MSTVNRVREEARQAEEQLRNILSKPAEPTAPAAPGAPAEPTAPAAPAAPESLDTQPPGDAPHPNAVAPAAPEPAAPIDAAAFAELQHKLDTLQGLYNRDKGQLAEAQRRVDMLERFLAARPADEPAAPAAQPAPRATSAAPKLVTDAEIKEFGDDLIDVIRRAAREEFHGPLNAVLNDVQQLVAKVASLTGTVQSTAGTVEQDAMNKFYGELDRLVGSDWRQINTAHERGDNSFVDWLQNVGQDSDEPRLHVLQRAYQRKDAAKCAGFFNAFKRDKGLPVLGDTPTPTAPTATVDPAAELVSPAPVAPAAPSANRGKKQVYKMSVIEQHFADYTKGKFKGKEDEYKRQAAEYEKAMLEGRVVP